MKNWRRRTVIWGAICLLLLAWGALGGGSAALKRNIWSVRAAKTVLNGGGMPAAPPAGDWLGRLWMGNLALQAGRPADAERWVSGLAQSGNPQALAILGWAYWDQGQPAQAIELWTKVKAVAFFEKAAKIADSHNQLALAEQAYRAELALDAARALFPLVDILTRQAKTGEAISMLQTALEKDANPEQRAPWLLRLGDLLRGQQRWEEAISVYERIVDYDTTYWMAYIGLGWAKYERGDGFDEALREFQKAISIPESKGNGQFAIAEILTREKRFEEADAWFAQALALNPDAQWWYVARANAARQAGNLALALAIYQEALARFPDFAYMYYEIAYAYQLNEQPAQAIIAIQQALALMVPPNANYYVRAGGIYEWAGDKNRALNAYRQALLIDPQNAAALKGVERLDK
jgi:tetratricopeptide (TPR) repeat protein